MGPVVVLMVWGVVAAVLSVACGVALRGIAWAVTRRWLHERKRVITVAALLPAAGFVYLFGCLLVFSVWSLARGRDMGWGDSWDTPILGTYSIEMIDVMDHGTLYNSANHRVNSRGGSLSYSEQDRDVVGGVRRLEVANPYIVGSAGPDEFAPQGASLPEDRFFILNTRTNARTDYASLAELERAARELKLPFALETIEDIYGAHRYDRLDILAASAFAVPPLIALYILLRLFLRLRAKEQAWRTAEAGGS